MAMSRRLQRKTIATSDNAVANAAYLLMQHWHPTRHDNNDVLAPEWKNFENLSR
jgi:hypothetical protein